MSETKLIALLGTPLGHSCSPTMQNEAYRVMGFPAHYLLMETSPELLANTISNIRKDSAFVGFALTTPVKEPAVPLVDELDPLARKMGAINTVVRREDGSLKGYNTDGYGAVRSLEEEGVVIEGNSFFVWGAGGAARAICFTLAQREAERIWICSRSDRCEKLTGEINTLFGGEVAAAVRASDTAVMNPLVESADVLLNLSGAGMQGREGETPVDSSCLRPGQVCFDATYNPVQTRFLAEAEARGCRTINGMGMIVYQGARQIELWTGTTKAPVEQMFRAVRQMQ